MASLIGVYCLDKSDHRSLSGPTSADFGPGILASWVQVVPGNSGCAPEFGDESAEAPAIGNCEPKFSARAVVRVGKQCPSVVVRDKSGERVIKLLAREPRDGFESVTVCGVPIGSPRTVTFPDQNSIPVKTSDWELNGPPKIVFLGDSGCRGMQKEQPCIPSDWPFRSIADKSASDRPNLVVHLGDYMYMGEDVWDDWNRYFFKPARSLLGAAPWIAVRGNHERCSNENHWKGFDLFFGDESAVVCNNNSTKLAKPYAVDLSKKLRLIIADSAEAYAEKSAVRNSTMAWPSSVECPVSTLEVGEKKNAEEAVCTAIMQVLSNAARLAYQEGEKQVWLATHVPVVGIERDKNDVDYIPESSAMMLAAWRAVKSNDSWPFDFILSGDRHLYQVIEFNNGTTSQVKQLVVGTAGVLLDDLPFKGSSPVYASFDKKGHSDFYSSNGCSYKDHGYLVAKWHAASYEFEFKPWSSSSGSNPCPVPR